MEVKMNKEIIIGIELVVLILFTGWFLT